MKRVYGWAGGRTLRHNQIFSNGKFTKFCYPWCSAARALRARELRYYFLPFSLPSPSSLVLLSSSNGATMVTWRHTSPLYWKCIQWIIQNTKRTLSRRKKTLSRFMYPHLRKSGFRNPRKFCLWNPESRKFLFVESGILGFGKRNTAQGIRNPLACVAGVWKGRERGFWARGKREGRARRERGGKRLPGNHCFRHPAY